MNFSALPSEHKRILITKLESDLLIEQAKEKTLIKEDSNLWCWLKNQSNAAIEEINRQLTELKK